MHGGGFLVAYFAPQLFAKIIYWIFGGFRGEADKDDE
jgi:hypothetical protein